MRSFPAVPALLVVAAALVLLTPGVAGQSSPPIGIQHTPPSGVGLGLQVYLTAVLTNATDATVSWRNDTMTADGVVPMTNVSQANGTGWVYVAYIPAQSSPTQIVYAINASNAGGFHVESFFFSVDAPSTSGLTAADQESWIWTMAASLAMIVSTVVVLYWYIGRRLAREVR